MGIRFVTYFTQVGQELVMVPDFPAWVCDVCGNTIYDFKAVNLISTLLSPTTGHTSGNGKHRKGSPDDREGNKAGKGAVVPTKDQ